MDSDCIHLVYFGLARTLLILEQPHRGATLGIVLTDICIPTRVHAASQPRFFHLDRQLYSEACDQDCLLQAE